MCSPWDVTTSHHGNELVASWVLHLYTFLSALMAENEEELKSLLMTVQENSEKAGLKPNILKTKIMASSPITSWQIERKKVEAVTDFIFYWAPKSLWTMTQFSSVQSLSCVRLFATPWIAARQASLSITNSRSSLRLTSIESVMPFSHLILCHPPLLLPPIPPSIRVFSMTQLFSWGGQSTGVSALASFLPKKSQSWSPSEWTGWISLQSKGLSRVFSNTTV